MKTKGAQELSFKFGKFSLDGFIIGINCLCTKFARSKIGFICPRFKFAIQLPVSQLSTVKTTDKTDEQHCQSF